MLTKEECLEGLKLIDDRKGSRVIRGKSIIRNLIDEHFELVEESKASDSKFLHNISKLESEITLLKRENKALADDNEMKCELNEKLRKDFELVCKLHDELLEENEKMKKLLDTFK